MLEGVLASLIDRIAGKYVDGIDKKATNMSVWSGHIVLKDLALKPTCLDDMDLPIKMRYGRLEQLSLDIPWKNLRAKPVIVHLSGLYMIVGPNTDASRSAQESKRLEVRPTSSIPISIILILVPIFILILSPFPSSSSSSSSSRFPFQSPFPFPFPPYFPISHHTSVFLCPHSGLGS
jgi:hypothetical protein